MEGRIKFKTILKTWSTCPLKRSFQYGYVGGTSAEIVNDTRSGWEMTGWVASLGKIIWACSGTMMACCHKECTHCIHRDVWTEVSLQDMWSYPLPFSALTKPQRNFCLPSWGCASRMMQSDRRFWRKTNISYKERLNKLELISLEKKNLRKDMISVLKNIKGGDPFSRFVTAMARNDRNG